MTLTVPDLSMKHLRAMVSVARYGSFSAAAVYLHISQPGLSRIIQQAEDILEVKLFARSTRNVVQTEAGRQFIPVAERLLGELTQQTQRMQTLDGELRGQLIIASLMSISHRVLPAALVVFRRQHPKMYIQIRDGLASNVQEDVRGGIADFGIGSAVGLPESVVAESITQEACYALLPRRHRLSRRSYIRLKDVTDEPMISMPTDSALRRTIDTVASAQGVALNHSIVTNQFTSLFDFVAAGLGIAIVPAAVIPPAKEFSIVVRPLRPTMTRRIGILHLADRSLSLASQAFLDIFRPAFVTATRQQEGRK